MSGQRNVQSEKRCESSDGLKIDQTFPILVDAAVSFIVFWRQNLGFRPSGAEGLALSGACRIIGARTRLSTASQVYDASNGYVPSCRRAVCDDLHSRTRSHNAGKAARPLARQYHYACISRRAR